MPVSVLVAMLKCLFAIVFLSFVSARLPTGQFEGSIDDVPFNMTLIVKPVSNSYAEQVADVLVDVSDYMGGSWAILRCQDVPLSSNSTMIENNAGGCYSALTNFFAVIHKKPIEPLRLHARSEECIHISGLISELDLDLMLVDSNPTPMPGRSWSRVAWVNAEDNKSSDSSLIGVSTITVLSILTLLVY